MQYEKLINDSALLKTLSQDEIRACLAAGQFHIAAYKKNTMIHLENEPCTKLEIILSGSVTVERIDESGGLMTVAEFFQGDLLGGNLLFSKNAYYPMTIMARRHTVILEMNKELLFELFCVNPGFLRLYLEYVSDHTFLLGDKIKHYVNKTIRESVMSYLKYESRTQGINPIRLNITKKALAEKIGVQRTSLSRELAKMRRDGLISYDQKTIKLLTQEPHNQQG